MLGLHDLEHIVILKVASLKRSRDFYANKMGLNVIVSGSKEHGRIKNRPQICLDQLGTRSKYTPRHVCPGSSEIHFFSKRAIEELEHILLGQQIPIISRDTFYNEEREEQECIYLHDPDGNLLRITGSPYPNV
ncbi:VOC family protein [Pareuzebyella sediminis]|uniref:VOC family protein n=1 Tax=Pareuzebyella sediminis TaxID=2607998 RepID=UPI0011EF9DD1|nr:VOC family protein [Pareuzebyella sediminis]